MTAEATAHRLKLLASGYCPIPLYGKEPPVYNAKKKNNRFRGLAEWESLTNVTREQIEMWDKTWPDSTNTGALTRTMPVLDLDILNEEAARACEDFVHERYEDAGHFLSRIGLPPKRAIPFRTEEPFKKFVVNLIAPNAKADAKPEKIEFLADGEQVVVDGIHPDTGKPYHWHGGELGEVRHEDLPYIREAEAQTLVNDLVELLSRDHGYKRAPGRPSKGNGKTNARAAESDWSYLFDNIRQGRELHDSLRDLAAKMIAAGTNSGAVINQLRALMEASAAPKDERWRARVREIPDAVDSAVAKYGKQDERPPLPDPAAAPASGYTIADAFAVFRKWLILPSPIAFYAMVGTIAANMLPGDPVWLGIVAPPSSAKTEMLNSVAALPHIHATATLTEAALLSGVPKKQHTTNAKGGLLREIGAFGILLLKDFGSILSMHPENKAKLLAALREIFDGSWRRDFGTDGGKSASWKGKLGLIFAVTGAIDQHRSIDDELGQRFLLSRLSPTRGQFRYALKHSGVRAAQMRKELSDAIVKLFSTPLRQPRALADNEINELERTINLVVRMRGATARDRFKRELEFVYGEEGTGRIGLCLTQLLAGLDSLGLDRAIAMKVVISVALDSVPPLRRQAYEWLCKRKTDFEAGKLAPVIDKNGNKRPAPLKVTTAQVATALDYPTNTIRRVLEDLAVYHLIKRTKGKGSAGDQWHVVDSDAPEQGADGSANNDDDESHDGGGEG